MSAATPRILLGELATLVTKGTTPKTLGYLYTKTGIPFLRAENISDLSVKWSDDALYIDEVTDKALSRSRIFPNDVLISIAGTIGRVGVVPEEAPPLNCNQAVAIVRPGPRVSPRYLAYWLSCGDAQRQIAKAQVTATISNLSLGQISKLEVPLPPLPEQRRIADILDKADAIRRKRKQAIALTDQLLRSTFLEMFGDPVTNPKGWPVATVGDLCEQGGNLVDGPFGSSLKPEHYTSSGVRVIRNWNIRDDFFDESDFRYVDLTKFEEIRRSEVSAGDILITTKGTVGDICMMPSLAGESVLSASGTVRLRLPPHSVLLAPFVVWQMILPSYKQYLHSFEAGSAQQYLNLSAIKKMRLVVPSMVYQQRFCDLRLRVLGIKKKQEAAQLDTAALFSSLTDRAFRGELSHTEQVAGQLSMFNK